MRLPRQLLLVARLLAASGHVAAPAAPDSSGSSRLVAQPNLSFSAFNGSSDLQFRPLPYNGLNRTWAFSVSVCDSFASTIPSQFFSTAAVVAASKKYGLLTPGLECAGVYEQVKGTTTGAVAEWANEFSAMDYVHYPSALCVNYSLPSLRLLHGVVPRMRQEALARLQDYFRCRIGAVF